MGFNNNFGCDDCRRGHDRFDRFDRRDRDDRFDRRRHRPNRGPEVGLFFGFPRFFR